MNDLIYTLLLTPTKFQVVVGVLLLGLLLDWKSFFYVAVWVGWAMIATKLLKSLFNLPIQPLVEGSHWAYPSGHTVTAFTLWFWCIGTYFSRTSALLMGACSILTLMFISSTIGMLHFEYHRLVDLLAALPFAGAFALGAHFSKSWCEKKAAHARNRRLLLVTAILAGEIAICMALLQYQLWTYQLYVMAFTIALGLSHHITLTRSILFVSLCGLTSALLDKGLPAMLLNAFAACLLLLAIIHQLAQKRHEHLKTYASKD
jgi:hypothetical protein